ncbi:MAG TPA: DUF1697 domain-containing protein [Stellaceae bacterium]|jgi:uncharacterized protein (DUF1697 family)
MPCFIALLRAVNVGGTGKLPMADLKAICGAAGFAKVQTYIASGNVVFAADADEAAVKTALETGLERFAGRKIGVVVRSAPEMAAVVADNPFPTAPGNRVMAIFLDAAPATDALASATGVQDEEMRLGRREIYVHYPGGMGRSKLRVPAASQGTARNMNTVARLAALCGL